MYETDETCQTCYATLVAYEVYDPETGDTVDEEVVCPNDWRQDHL